MAMQAQETFVAEIDGAPLFVARGSVFPDKHPVVLLDAGRGLLFRQLDIDEVPAPKAAAVKRAPAAPSGKAGS